MTAASGAFASGTYFRPGRGGVTQYTGPDSLGRGQYLIGARLDYSDYASVRAPGGPMPIPGGVHHRTYSLTGEYGFTDRATGYLVLPYVRNTTTAPSGPGQPGAPGQPFSSTTGLGDIRLGTNILLRENQEKANSLVGTLEVTVPGQAYDTTKLTAPGDNSTDLLARLGWRMRPTEQRKWFYSVGAGYRLRMGTAADTIVWDAEAGIVPTANTAVSTFLQTADDRSGVNLMGPGFTGDFARLKKSLTVWGIKGAFGLGTDQNLIGEIYWAKAIRFQNQAPIEYWGLGLTGRF
jgi:hypothetical protein